MMAYNRFAHQGSCSWSITTEIAIQRVGALLEGAEEERLAKVVSRETRKGDLCERKGRAGTQRLFTKEGDRLKEAIDAEKLLRWAKFDQRLEVDL